MANTLYTTLKGAIFIKRVVQILLTILIVIMGIYYIWFDHRMLFKLIPMVLIIIYGILHLPSKQNRKAYHTLTVVGLLFCISGDYLLQWFIIGLFAFLCGHIFYIFSFRQQIKAQPDFMRTVIIIYALIMMTIMTIALMQKGIMYLIVPVILYTTIIGLMAYTAWRTRNKWLIVGSLLFLLSDSILAWDRFVSDIASSSVLIMTTYYSANYFIATSLKSK